MECEARSLFQVQSRRRRSAGRLGPNVSVRVRSSPCQPRSTWIVLANPYQPSPTNVSPGRQNDGVHRVQADYPIGVVVYGFDLRVSYAYAGGTELKDLNPR